MSGLSHKLSHKFIQRFAQKLVAKRFALSVTYNVRTPSPINGPYNSHCLNTLNQKFSMLPYSSCLASLRSIHSTSIKIDEFDEELDTAEAEKNNRTVFVVGLDRRLTDDQFLENLQKYGEVETAHIAIDPLYNVSKGFGFATFAKLEDAERAIGELEGSTHNGYTLHAAKSHSRSRSRSKNDIRDETKLEPVNTVFVANLPYDSTENDLLRLFQPFGDVCAVNMPIDRITQKIKGFAFVNFNSIEEATNSIKGLCDSTLGGNTLVIKYSKSSTRR